MEFSACNRRFTTQPTLFFCELRRHGGVQEGVSHLTRETRPLSARREVKESRGFLLEMLCGHRGPPNRAVLASRCRRHLARTNCRSLSDP